MKPTIGRIVHLNLPGAICPAIITRVWTDTCVNVVVFNPTGLVESEPTFVKTSVTYDETGAQPYTWRWPPREA